LIINAPSFQDYIRKNIISYVNLNTDNTIQISDSKFNLKGDLVISGITLSDVNSDTIIKLESLTTKYIPLISNLQYDSSLNIDGLKLFINQRDQELEEGFNMNTINVVFDNIFFDNLNITNSYVIFVNDSIQNQISIYNSSLKEINRNKDGVEFNIESFSGSYDNLSIDGFYSTVNLNKSSITLNNLNVINKESFLRGNIEVNLDDGFKFKKISNSSINFNINPILFESLQTNYNINDNISGELKFYGTKEDLTINRLKLSSELFEFNAQLNILDVLAEEIEINALINDLDINEEYLSYNYEINQKFNLPLLKGDLNINNKNLTINLSEKESSETKLNLTGTANLDDSFNYQIGIISKLGENDEILDALNLTYIDVNALIRGSSKELNYVNSNVNLIKNNNEFNLKTDSYIRNNTLDGSIGIYSDNINIESSLSGNILKKVFDVNSKIDINVEDRSGDIEFSTQSNLKINLSNAKNIISFLKLNQLYFKNSNDEIKLENLFELNKILDTDFINQESEFDFEISLTESFLKIDSFLGERFKINGYFRDDDDLNFDIKISDVLVENFFDINKSPISGSINSYINIKRSPENRTLRLDSNFSNLQIKDYDLGELNVNVFGNTDYNSYAINIDLSKEELTSVKGEGSIILTDEDPNIDIDIIIEDFDISFVEKIGLNTISNISSIVSGEINLWGKSNSIQHNGKLYLNQSKFKVPYLNIEYLLSENSEIDLYNQNFEFNNVNIKTESNDLPTSLVGKITHQDYKNWNLDLDFQSERLYILNKEYDETEGFYGRAYMGGGIEINGPTNQVSIDINGVTKSGTSITIPQSNNYSIDDFSFITFTDLNSYSQQSLNSESISGKINKTLDLNMNLQINDSAELEITIDQETGSYLSGKGNGDLLMEIDSDGKFNIYGDYTTNEGIYNFRNLALIDKKFQLKKGGTITWDGDPLSAQMNIQATYEVPGGANPALLLDNPNFNKKIPTNVDIKLTGELTKPDSPDFEIFFPNTSSTVTSEINYRLNDPEVRQLQAISLLTQGIFINEVSVSIEGVTNNIYEKVSEVFSDILGGSEGPLKVGLNYLQGDKSEILDIKTEDRFGVTLSTKISDKILFNGKIGVPIGGIEETLIIGDVQIDFILNDDGTLRAKVFNKENEFRYIGDELGYTQGVGLSYQVDFQTFRSLLSKIIANNN
jgi:hypothetical protein